TRQRFRRPKTNWLTWAIQWLKTAKPQPSQKPQLRPKNLRLEAKGGTRDARFAGRQFHSDFAHCLRQWAHAAAQPGLGNPGPDGTDPFTERPVLHRRGAVPG